MDIFWSIVWAFVVRIGQAAILASPTIVCGFLVAGILRRMLSPQATCNLFGGGGWSGLPRAWAIGTLLPVCSFGVIPVARELRRAGVPSGTVLTFALTAPLLNPLSILYGLTLSQPFVIFSFILLSMVVAVIAGWAWNIALAKTGDTLEAVTTAMPPEGLKRLAAVAVTAGKESIGPTIIYLLIGLAGVAFLSAILPGGYLQHTMLHGDPKSPPLMALVSLPAYAPPMDVMKTLGIMFDHGNSVGAAYVLLVLGAGMNVGLLAWMVHHFGLVRPLVWLSVVVVLAIGIGYAVEYPLNMSLRPATHSHAFDHWTTPFDYRLGWDAINRVGPMVTEVLGPLELPSLCGWGLLVLIGLGAMLTQRFFDLEGFLVASPPQSNKKVPVWNRPIPPKVLGIIALVGLALAAVLGAYIYYPDPGTVFAEMSRAKASSLQPVISLDPTNDPKNSRSELEKKELADLGKQELRRFGELIKKLQVGVYIRNGSLTQEQRDTSEELLYVLEEIYDALDHGDYGTANEVRRETSIVYDQCREAFLGGS
ncbi:MAG: permease [Gemmataceae bacterium]